MSTTHGEDTQVARIVHEFTRPAHQSTVNVERMAREIFKLRREIAAWKAIDASVWKLYGTWAQSDPSSCTGRAAVELQQALLGTRSQE
jgi:hypothetical protein